MLGPMKSCWECVVDPSKGLLIPFARAPDSAGANRAAEGFFYEREHNT